MSASYLDELEDRALDARESETVPESESPFMPGESSAQEFPEPQATGQMFPGVVYEQEAEGRETAPAAESSFRLGEPEMEQWESFEEPSSQPEMRAARDDEADAGEVRLEDEFRVDRLPEKARAQFSKTDSAAWRQALEEAIGAGVKDPNVLADLIFFMQHRDRVVSGVGKPIATVEPDFVKLRAEWDLYRTIATRRLNPSAACSVFLPDQPSSDWEQYVAKATTGRMTLLVNGRTSGADKTEAFGSMQQTVESLGPGDTVYLAAFQVNPTKLTAPGPAGVTSWADLLVSKAKQGVKIRIIMTDIPENGPTSWKSDLSDLNTAIGLLPVPARDNLKYIVSMHPAQLRFKLVSVSPLMVQVVPTGGLLNHVGTHHQKFMVARKSGTTIAYCGGLDISPQRTPQGWPDNKLQPKTKLVWHDTHVKLEGLIARDLEREFVLRWNREKDKSTAAKLPDWKPFENLVQAPLGGSDREAARNTQKLQMLRTVAVGATAPDIRRDDVWQGYFRLIGCATRFLYMENQYFHEPAMADAIVKQAEAHPELIVIIVVAFEIDDPSNQLTEHGRALQNEFFKRLFKIPESRRRVYTMVGRLVHAKLILADDRALSVGSTNADPRDFFMDTQLNVMLDDPQAVEGFRHQLWSHDLGIDEADLAALPVSGFIAQWDKVANANEPLKATPEKMKGEGVVPFDPTTVKGKLSGLPNILAEVDGGERAESEQFAEAGESETLEMPNVREDGAVGEDETPVVFEHDLSKTGTRVVSVGERVELDLDDIEFAHGADNIKWTIPGTVVRGYDGGVHDAKLFKLTDQDLGRPKISFFWVDAADGRRVVARFRTKPGGLGQAVFDFDVKGPRVSDFTATTGVTRLERSHGFTAMTFGTPRVAPGVRWKWTITMPPTHAGHVKDVQTVVNDRSKIVLRKPGGGDTRSVWRHPAKKDTHVQLDGTDRGQAVYTGGLLEPTIEAGASFQGGPTEDSPHGALPSLGKTVSANDRFTYYVMYRPVTAKDHDAIWVPVAKATWFWKATATQQRDKTWTIDQPKPKMEANITMATADFPMYETNAEENEWQEAP